MKIVHSLWTKPMLNSQTKHEFDRFDGGWSEKKYNYMSWALSCLQFGKFYDEIELYTDKYGKEILIDKLQLPYTKVHVVLDELNHYHPELWAIGKLYTYSLQKEPFLHVDGDAYIWGRFDSELENSPLVAQNLENNFPYYSENLKWVQDNFTYMPKCVKNHKLKDIRAINAGILGGDDIEFVQEYTKSAFEFVDKNMSYLETQKGIGMFNTIYEQFLFYNLAKEKEKDITYLLKDITPAFTGLDNFHRIPVETKYVHLIGVSKKTHEYVEEIANRLLLDYPEYYFKIEDLLYKMMI